MCISVKTLKFSWAQVHLCSWSRVGTACLYSLMALLLSHGWLSVLVLSFVFFLFSFISLSFFLSIWLLLQVSSTAAHPCWSLAPWDRWQQVLKHDCPAHQSLLISLAVAEWRMAEAADMEGECGSGNNPLPYPQLQHSIPLGTHSSAA